MDLINKIGLFRLVLVPLAIWILYTAWQTQEWLMGVIGFAVLVFGLLNRCLIGGKCETDFNPPNRQ